MRQEVLLGILTEGKIVIRGGSILEVNKVKVRDVQGFNDPAPGDRPGNTVGNMGQLEEDVWSALDSKGWGMLRDDGILKAQAE